MANSRPVSMIISSNSVSDEITMNGSKSILSNKDSLSIRSSNEQKIPINNIINANSSSSSIDSAGAKNTIFTEKQMSSQVNSNATISSTTTDSELESEQEERYIDNNNLLEFNNIPIQIQQQLSRRDSEQQKNDTNSQEQVSRRVKHFQKLFKSEIPDDMPELIDSYVCAYQGDILLQGKMYITDRYLCFHSRIISYITKHVYRWEQIENVTKERVAFIFPTAIGIQLKHSGKKIIYASFLQRDQAFDKIIYMCSRFNNDTNSLQDDDDNHSTQGGTLKALNSNHNYNEKIKKIKHDISYDMIDEPEPDEVLQMCLTPNNTTTITNNNNHNNNKQRQQFTLSKNFDIKQQLKQPKKLFNSNKNKSFKHSNINSQLIKNFNENISDNNEFNRNSSSNNNNHQEKETDTILSSAPVVFRQSRSTPLRTNRSRSRDRTLSPSNRTSSNILSSNSSTSSITNTDSLIINSNNNNGLIGRYTRIIILSIISIIKLIMEYLLLLFNRFKTYPIKTSLILLIFIIILIIHSFYLINVAYRIENRLQSLYPLWPSSSMKNSRRLQNEL